MRPDSVIVWIITSLSYRGSVFRVCCAANIILQLRPHTIKLSPYFIMGDGGIGVGLIPRYSDVKPILNRRHPRYLVRHIHIGRWRARPFIREIVCSASVCPHHIIVCGSVCESGVGIRKRGATVVVYSVYRIFFMPIPVYARGRRPEKTVVCCKIPAIHTMSRPTNRYFSVAGCYC